MPRVISYPVIANADVFRLSFKCKEGSKLKVDGTSSGRAPGNTLFSSHVFRPSFVFGWLSWILLPHFVCLWE